MELAKEFSTNFHNLKGITIGEKRKSFFLLREDLKLLNPYTINTVVSSLTPKNHLESVFRVELLIFFRRTTELFEVLKGGNEELCTKIFRQPWFFQHPFDDFDAEAIVSGLLPYLSFVTRNRVIRSLAKYHKTEKKLDDVFDVLLERYGINTAKLLLPGCSVGKMRETLGKYRPGVSPSALLSMFKKDPHLFEVFLNSCHISFDDNDVLLQEVILKETDMFIAHRKSYLYYNLGRRSTRRLLRHSKDYIISNSCEYSKILHLRTAYHFLTKRDALTFLENMYPECIKDFRYVSIIKMLKYFPKKERFIICAQIFEKKYKKTIWDDDSILDEALFREILLPEEREKWISMKIKSVEDPERFFPYYEITRALGLIKEKINVTTAVHSRSNLIELLIDACKFNENTEALYDALEYFCKRHRNDDETIRSKFLDSLISNFDVSDLDSKSWKCINEILEIQRIRKEEYGKRKEFLLKYLLHIWKNKMPCEEKLKCLILAEELGPKDKRLVSELKCEDLERMILIKLIEISPERVVKDSALYEEDSGLVVWITTWNKSHENTIPLSDYPRLATSVIKFTDNCMTDGVFNYTLSNLFSIFICADVTEEFSEHLTQVYFQAAIKRYAYDTKSIIPWYLKHNPVFLMKHVDKVIESMCSVYTFYFDVWLMVKRLSYLGIYEKAIQYCLENYTDSRHFDIKLKVLAALMCPEDFLNVISKHVPSRERLDIDDEESKSDYTVQTNVAASFKYTKSVTVLPMLIKFCMGDYLRYALESLYYLFYHSPENKLDTFIKDLSDKAVSVRKHALFLISQVGSIQNVFILLKQFMEKERNASMKKHLLNTALRYFKKSPSDKFFELLLSCIPSMSLADTESIEAVTSVREIPVEYKGKYFVFILDHLTSLVKEHRELSSSIDKLLDRVDTDLMKSLPHSYCVPFIEKYFLQEHETCSKSKIEGFVIIFLISCEYDFVEKINYILKKLVNCQKDVIDWEKKLKILKSTQNFLTSTIDHLKWHGTIDQMKIFYSMLFEHFRLEDYYSQYVNLNIVIMQKESDNNVMYSRKIHAFLNEITTKYSSYLIEHLASSLKDECPHWKKRDENLHELCWELWKISQSVDTCLLILHLLPKTPPETPENYITMLEAIESKPDATLKVLFYNYIYTLD